MGPFGLSVFQVLPRHLALPEVDHTTGSVAGPPTQRASDMVLAQDRLGWTVESIGGLATMEERGATRRPALLSADPLKGPTRG